MTPRPCALCGREIGELAGSPERVVINRIY
jgi:hypothetical protein